MNEPLEQIAFKLVNSQVTELNFNINKDFVYPKKGKDNLELKVLHEVLFSNEDPKKFIVVFYLSIDSKLEIFSLALTYKALYEAGTEINEAFKNSSFVTSSAPAIAYPYVRAFVSNLSINAGLKPIILPTLNFTKLVDEPNQVEKEEQIKKPLPLKRKIPIIKTPISSKSKVSSRLSKSTK